MPPVQSEPVPNTQSIYKPAPLSSLKPLVVSTGNTKIFFSQVLAEEILYCEFTCGVLPPSALYKLVFKYQLN